MYILHNAEERKKNMEKTYEALMERLRRSRDWHNSLANDMSNQPDLNEYEKECIAEDRAIVSFLNTVLRVETMG